MQSEVRINDAEMVGQVECLADACGQSLSPGPTPPRPYPCGNHDHISWHHSM